MSAIRQEMAELLAPMNPEIFEFEDESHLHAGHAGNRGGGHYFVLVVSEVFAGQPRIARWRKVQAALAPLFQAGKIHALSIQAHTPSEYFHSH